MNKNIEKKLLAALFAATFGLGAGSAMADSKDALFGDDDDDKPTAGAAAPTKTSEASGFKGWTQFEFAYAADKPRHWSKALNRTELSMQGKLAEGIKYKISARADTDAVHLFGNHYPEDVRRDQRFDLMLRENYIDFNAGDWDFRIGRQHVIWGEMVGLFFADVVSARNMREFILPEFDILRIPQWAARAEYFSDAFHAELLWIPKPSYDQIGKPGAEFYPVQPVPPGVNVEYRPDQRPASGVDRGNYGARVSTLRNGWDVSAFFYRSMDAAPTFYREILPAQNTIVYTPYHDRITQYGGTFAKDFGSVVLKGEGVYTAGRKFQVTRQAQPNGVVAQDTLDWVLGLEFALANEARFNVQLFQTVTFGRDPDLIQDKYENGYSLLWNSKLAPKLEGEVILLSSFNRNDWLARPRLKWNFEKNWRMLVGADIFDGASNGIFGRYDKRDRLYTEVRYSF